MRNYVLAAAVALGVTLSIVPAYADVKAGVEAWAQGKFEDAVAHWRIPAQTGDADAQFNLGQAYRFGRGVPMDLNMAENWYRRAARLGHVRAEENLGLVLFQKGNYDEAFPLLEKAAKREDPRAQYVLGTALFNGDLIEKDWARAYALMLRASANGLGRATTHLTEMNKYVSAETRAEGISLAEKLKLQARDLTGEVAHAPAMPPATPPAPRGPDLLPPLPSPPVEMQTAAANMEPAGNGLATDAPMPPQPAAPARVAMTMDNPAEAKVARPASPKPEAGRTRWQVQLGAFRSSASARSMIAYAKTRLPSLAKYTVRPQSHGDLTAVRAGPINSREEAARLCAKLRSAKQACIVVRA